jgi:hypothetical protein
MSTAFARRRKARFAPDDRPDWRDPNMKCFETMLFSDGVWRDAYIPPDMKQKFAQDRLAQYQTPGWINDPAYGWRRKKLTTAG